MNSYDVIHRSRRTKGVLAQGDVEAAYEGIVHGTFDRVVLCAYELEEMFSLMMEGKPKAIRDRILFAPNDDGATMTRRQIRTAANAAKECVRHYRKGERVLVTCAAGRNRSGLVTAMALHFISGCGGKSAVEIVRARRKAKSGPALSNPLFEKFLCAIPPKQKSIADSR